MTHRQGVTGWCRRKAWSRLSACALATVGSLLACTSDAQTATEPEAPQVPEGEPRTFGMGWAVTPPRATTESVIQTAQQVARLGEFTILQQAPPWTKILAGEPMDVLIEEPAGLADFMKAQGQELVLLVDPLDGLNRRAEPYELVQAGRSIREPEIRALHEAWVRRLTARLEPAYLGLASEINTLGAHGDPELYAELVDMINGLAPEMRVAHPGIEVFVSFQVDDAWGLLIPDGSDHFGLIDDFDIDVLGLSSYPVFAFDRPDQIPPDYFSIFRDYTDLPFILVEGGWSSAPTTWSDGTPQQQTEFFRIYERLLDGVDAELWVFLIYADMDLEGWGLPPERQATLSNFAHMGIVDVDFTPKPAYAEWERILARPWDR